MTDATDTLRALLADKVAVTELPYGLLGLEPAIAEAQLWLADTRPYAGDLRRASVSCFGDLLDTLASFGPSVADHVATQANSLKVSLEPLMAQQPPRPQEERQRAKSALDAFEHRLRDAGSTKAAWSDLVHAVDDHSDIDTLRPRTYCLYALLAYSGADAESTFRRASGVLGDDAYEEAFARYLVGQDSRETIDARSLLGNVGGVPQAERIELCEQLLSAPWVPRHHVVWVAFDHAHVASHPGVAVGRMQFFEVALLRSAIEMGTSATPLPTELFQPGLTVNSIPAGEVVLARVDLGTRPVAGALEKARELARSAVDAAHFNAETGAAGWSPTDDYIHFVDGHYAGELMTDRRDPPVGRMAMEKVGTELAALGSTALADPSWLDENVARLETVTWFRRASSLSGAPRLLLDMRVVEHATGKGPSADEKWWQYLDLYWKAAWIRHELGAQVAVPLLHAARIGEVTGIGIDRARNELIDDVVSLKWPTYSVRLGAAAGLLPKLAEMFPDDPIRRAVFRTLAERTSDPDAVRRWVARIDEQWDRLRARARRVRNALAHGDPVDDRVVNSAATFVHQLAASVIAIELEALTSRKSLHQEHDDLVKEASLWRKRLSEMSDVADAVT